MFLLKVFPVWGSSRKQTTGFGDQRTEMDPDMRSGKTTLMNVRFLSVVVPDIIHRAGLPSPPPQSPFAGLWKPAPACEWPEEPEMHHIKNHSIKPQMICY